MKVAIYLDKCKDSNHGEFPWRPEPAAEMCENEKERERNKLSNKAIIHCLVHRDSRPAYCWPASATILS